MRPVGAHRQQLPTITGGVVEQGDQLGRQRRRVRHDEPSGRVRRAQALDRRRRGQSVRASGAAFGAGGHDDRDRQIRRDRAHQPIGAFHGPVHHRGVEAQPVALLLHRLAPAGDGLVERGGRTRDRAGDVAPVVGEERKMHHAAVPRGDQFGGAQDEVVILRPVEVGAEPADLADHIAAQRREVARVHRRTKALGRPIGLEEMGRLAAVGQHVGLVAVHVVDAVGGVDGRRHPFERRGHELVVVVQQGDEVAASPSPARRSMRRRSRR